MTTQKSLYGRHDTYAKQTPGGVEHDKTYNIPAVTYTACVYMRNGNGMRHFQHKRVRHKQPYLQRHRNRTCTDMYRARRRRAHLHRLRSQKKRYSSTCQGTQLRQLSNPDRADMHYRRTERTDMFGLRYKKSTYGCKNRSSTRCPRNHRESHLHQRRQSNKALRKLRLHRNDHLAEKCA